MTCGYNPDIDFLLFTNDTTAYEYPPNVKVYVTTMEQMANLFQKHFDFPLALCQPYKLCDFKPTYGEVFSEYLIDYDYWGYSDCDLFWGNIRRFISDKILDKYQRIYTRGHCSVFRNTQKVNSWYRTLPGKGCQDWKKVLSGQDSFCFDEWAGHCGGGFSAIMKANGIEMYDRADMADLNRAKGYFKVNRWVGMNKRIAFHFVKGKLEVVDVAGNPLQEALYVHFQKRRISYKITKADKDEFYFSAPGVIGDEILEDRCGELCYEMKYMAGKIQKKVRQLRTRREYVL